MHRLTIPDTITEPIPVHDGQSMQPGSSYICANRFLGRIFDSQWRCTIRKTGEMWPARALVKATPWYHEPDFSAPDIWLFRGGGWGDILMMTPAIAALQKKYPDKKIHVACGDTFKCLFQGPGLDSVITESIPMLDDDSWRAIISFEEAIEGDPIAEKIHIAQVFARKCGVVLSSTRPIYNVTEEEADWAASTYSRISSSCKHRIGIQFLASGLYRSYPKMGSVVVELAKNHEVFLFGQKGQLTLKDPIPNVTNLMEDGLTFRQSAAVLATCDACIAPDSALVHLSSALGVPYVALFGPFPADLRVSGDRAIFLDGKAPCAPCFFHASSGQEFPAGMPCTDVGRCVALDAIPVESVTDAVRALL